MFNRAFGDVDSLVGVVNFDNFRLQDLPGFPWNEYQANKARYGEYSSWYYGLKLEEKQTQGGRTVDKYPIKLNPIRGAVYKHAYALFGETGNDSRPLAYPLLKSISKVPKEQLLEGNQFLWDLWYENSGRSLMIKNALLSQYLGGCVFKVSYIDPKFVHPLRKYPIKIEAIHPSNFVGMPGSGEEYLLQESWLVRTYSADEARRFWGIEAADEELVHYVEHWMQNSYDVTINGRPVRSGTKDPATGQEIMYGGENPFGFVPMVYIPHIRTETFYGDTLISVNVQGIVEELNKRAADYGDSVSDDSHRYYVLKNSSSKPDVFELAPGLRIVDIHSNIALTGKEGEPDMDVLGGPTASKAMGELVDQLYDQFRREAFIPAVADGEDEGSQRSALTLSMRMWPLISHTATERIFWTDGLNLIDKMILEISRIKGFGSLPESVHQCRIERRWSPILPRDTEAFINQLVNRAGVNLGSLVHLFTLLDDIEDPEEEYERVLEQIKEIAEIDTQSEVEVAKVQAEAFQNRMNQQQQKTGGSSNGTTGQSTKQSGSNK